MIFWIGILIGGLFAWHAVKTGFYETWTRLFNIVISIYLAVFVGPMIASIPGVSDTPCSDLLAVITTAIGAFLILYGISYVFFTGPGRLKISFPKVFDILGAGFLGFLAGLLLWSFVGLLIGISPISQNIFVKQMGFGSQQANVSYICWWCNLVNKVVSSRGNKYTAEQTIRGLLKSTEEKTRGTTDEQAEPDESAEPNDVETSSREVRNSKLQT